TGRQRTEADFRGKLLLLYFGFTYCPDLCPPDLQSIGLAIDQLGKGGEEVQPLFVTLDPDRDTPQHLANYVPLFHPRLIGLTGDPSSIRQAARAYKVYYAKVPTAGDEYTVDHSGYIYLMDRAGQYLGFFPPGTPPDRMADVIRSLFKQRISPPALRPTVSRSAKSGSCKHCGLWSALGHPRLRRSEHTTLHVRFAPESGQTANVPTCRLSAISGHMHCSKQHDAPLAIR